MVSSVTFTEIFAIKSFPAWTVCQIEALGQFAVGQHDDVVPPQPALRPPRVAFHEAAQRVASIARLPDRVDFMFLAAPVLSPPRQHSVEARRKASVHVE